MKKYPFYSNSPSDPAHGSKEFKGLGFDTLKQAQSHTDKMNKLVDDFDNNLCWNKQYWKSTPKYWIVVTI